MDDEFSKRTKAIESLLQRMGLEAAERHKSSESKLNSELDVVRAMVVHAEDQSKKRIEEAERALA
jgi:ElaB/YqjD/DUF883 family membrane-anchored ribosome-binding protein